jgi:P-type Cu+ transporter
VLDAVGAERVPIPPVSDAQALPGRGLQGTVDGQALALGSHRLLAELGVDPGELRDAADRHVQQGRTTAWLVRRTGGTAGLLGLLAFGDTVKPTARPAVARLHALGVKTILLTGDNAGSARAVAEATGIDEVRANVLPADKAGAVQALRAAGEVVAMVGDGINDAPALAAAHVGIAMGSGTDVAMETAGITLMRSDPRLVADAIDVSRRTTAKIRQNLGWAFVYNVLGIPLAALGLLNPIIAGAAMAASSVSVVTNALLLRRWRASADTRIEPARSAAWTPTA